MSIDEGYERDRITPRRSGEQTWKMHRHDVTVDDGRTHEPRRLPVTPGLTVSLIFLIRKTNTPVPRLIFSNFTVKWKRDRILISSVTPLFRCMRRLVLAREFDDDWMSRWQSRGRHPGNWRDESLVDPRRPWPSDIP